MQLGAKSRAAIDALALIAGAGSKPQSLSGIAERLGLSVSYLEQIFAVLRTARLVESHRGPGGGYRLATPPGQIGVMQICGLFETRSQVMDGEPHAGFWSGLATDITEVLSRRTLADVGKA